MQAREFGAAAHTETAARGNPGPGSFKSKKPTAVIATPDLDLWAQLGPMLESTVAMRHADSLQAAAAMLKPGTRTILLADLRGLSPDDFAPISASPHNPVVIAIRDGASAGMVDQLMLEGSIQALVDSPVESAAMLRAVSDAARISSTPAPRSAAGLGFARGVAWSLMKGSSTQPRRSVSAPAPAATTAPAAAAGNKTNTG